MSLIFLRGSLRINENELEKYVACEKTNFKFVVYDDGKSLAYIYRPSIPPKKYKNYDHNKNFQIWLKEGNREFKPNHLRIMIDLNLRVRSRPDLKKQLLSAFDNIYYGKDPEQELRILEKEKFEHFLNKIMLIGILSQLFHIEQEYNYNKIINHLTIRLVAK